MRHIENVRLNRMHSRNRVVPEDTHGFSPLLCLQQSEHQCDGCVWYRRGALSLLVCYHTHYRAVNNWTSGQSGDIRGISKVQSNKGFFNGQHTDRQQIKAGKNAVVDGLLLKV